ncbi:MAG: hypothetical protein R2710_10210 [Acidimicrobiales bacterium]
MLQPARRTTLRDPPSLELERTAEQPDHGGDGDRQCDTGHHDRQLG